ncbi:unnamed protein product [Ectocarpus sp. 12 AP-2014]
MLASTIAGRAAVRASRQGQRTVAAKLTSCAITAASPCSNLRSPLPGAYRETTELWHNDKAADAPADVVEWVWDNRQFRPNPAPPAPKTVKNEAELTKLLASDGLVVVKFHAVLCDASRAVEGRFKQTAAEFGDMDGKQVTFADVCFDSNRQLCKRMGIKSVPHVQIFSGSKGKIADFSIAPLQYNTLTSLLSERRDSVAAGGQL